MLKNNNVSGQRKQLAKAVVGEDGRLLVGAGHIISETVLKRMTNMGFQGAYIETPGFEDIIIDDVIPDEELATDPEYRSVMIESMM